VVEAKLKAGELAAVVATNSLELGIDIGALDEVLLVQTPPSAAATVQRVGRAGHSVGGVSRSKIYPLFPRDILDAAVATKLLLNGEIEPLAPVTNALDILAQILLSLTAAVTWQADALYDMVRATYPFRHLPRTQFDLVLNLLAGRYAETRIRELRPLILVDKLAGTVRARPESAKRLFLAGGTIPDRGQYTLRLANSNAKLGELDEEFVWERSVGDTFTLGVQTWRIDRVTHNDVLVSPAAKRAAMAPFWRADERDRSNFFTSRIGEFLEWIEPLLEDPALPGQLQREFFLDARAAKNLVQWLIFAKSVLGGRLPHRRRIVVERVAGETGSGEDGIEYLVHTFWGGRVNRPFALALSAAWEERYGAPLAIQHDDDALVVTSPGDINPGDLLRLVQPDRIEPLIRGKLGQTGYFGAKFREAAGRAMLLPKQSFRHRLPLWRLRERAKGLLQAVAKFADFPIILEAWRECLTDVFEIAALRSLLSEIQDGAIDVLVVSTRTPSPFASHLVWLRTNKLMYEDDVPPSSAAAAPGGDIIAEIARAADVRAAGSRPKIPELLCQTVQAKLQRTAPGYAPRDVDELLAWVSERVMIPKNEWRELTAAVQRDHNVNLTEWDQTLASRLVTVVLPQGHADGAVCHIEDVPGLLATLALERAAVTLTSLDSEPLPAETEPVLTASFTAAQRDGRLRCDVAQRLGQWLRFYGPVPIARVAAQWGASSDFYQALQTLIADGIAVTGELSAGAGAVEVCDLQNLERLLRGLRQASRPQFQPLAASLLPLLLAQWHGLNSNLTGEEGLARAFERLAGLPAPADLWETEILPARIREYSPVGLDALVTGCGLAWIGCGPRWLTFGSPDGRQLLGALVEPPEQLTDATVTGADMMADQVPEQTAAWPGSQLVDRVFPAGAGRFTFSELLEQSGMSPADLTRALWTLAWSGQITNSTFQAVRQGLAHGFQPAEPILQTGGNDRRPKLRFGQWRQTRAFSGAWHRLPDVPPAGDPLAEDELAKERARLALEHFGIVFRELLARELPALQWPRIFRALRLMELSGEVLSGAFFQGIPGPQFILPAAFALLRDGLNGDLSFWLNAADPAAPCGLGLTGLPSGLPKRMTANHLSFVGERLAFVSERGGRRLTISVTPGDPRLPDVIQPLVSAFTRRVQPRQVLIIEEINGEPAARSPFSTAFAGLFHVENEREGLRIRAYF